MDFDRTLELPAEPLDDLDELETTMAGPSQPRQTRKQIVSHPLSLDDDDDDDQQQEQELRIARELASRRLSIARREQRHRHAIELGDQRHRHEQRLLRGRQEARIVAGVLLLVVTSGLAWITMPNADAAQIVFTTSFGAVAGYLGGRTRREGQS
ncbi:hypothetical protein OEB96_43750 [Paraliomyxa miuraensis]|nr:hypothetical protein [Paraliomyxa miuraensis]